jgi:hypothetical protein
VEMLLFIVLRRNLKTTKKKYDTKLDDIGRTENHGEKKKP